MDMNKPNKLKTLPPGYEKYEEATWNGSITHIAPFVRPHYRLYVHFIRQESRTGFEEFVTTIRVDPDEYFNLEGHLATSFNGVIIINQVMEFYSLSQFAFTKN